MQTVFYYLCELGQIRSEGRKEIPDISVLALANHGHAAGNLLNRPNRFNQSQWVYRIFMGSHSATSLGSLFFPMPLSLVRKRNRHRQEAMTYIKSLTRTNQISVINLIGGHRSRLDLLVYNNQKLNTVSGYMYTCRCSVVASFSMQAEQGILVLRGHCRSLVILGRCLKKIDPLIIPYLIPHQTGHHH